MKQEYKSELEKVLNGKIVHSEEMTSGNNLVYLIDVGNFKFVAKFFQNKNLHVDNEIMLSNALPLDYKKYLKEIIHTDMSCNKIDVPYAIFEKIEGDLLLNKLNKKSLDASQTIKVAESIYDFIQGVFSLKSKRFGYLKGSFEGTHDYWMDFLFDYQVPTIKTLMTHPQSREYSKLPFKILDTEYDSLDTGMGCVVPLDLNMSNFMINLKGDLKVVDPGTIISGNKLAAYGEFTAHTYGTQLYDAMKKIAFPEKESEKIVRSFATLSNLNVLAFIVRHGAKDLKKITPWGNQNTFFNLVDSHLNYIYEGKQC